MSWTALKWRQVRLRRKLRNNKPDYFSLEEIIKVYPYLDPNLKSTLEPNRHLFQRKVQHAISY